MRQRRLGLEVGQEGCVTLGALGLIDPALRHQEQRGPDLRYLGELSRLQAFLGELPVLGWCYHSNSPCHMTYCVAETRGRPNSSS